MKISFTFKLIFALTAIVLSNSFSNPGQAQTVITTPIATTSPADSTKLDSTAGGTARASVNQVTVVANIVASSSQNYITTYTPNVAGLTTAAAVITASSDKTQVKTSIQYLDGLGRPMQTIQVQGTHAGLDLVTPIVYDQFGRASKTYLSYAATTSDGSFKTDATTTNAGVFNFYNPTHAGVSGTQQSNGIVVNPAPYTDVVYEASPLNRPTEQSAPGTPWQIGGGHTTKTAYSINGATDVILWTMNSAGTGATGATNYGAGQLYVTTTTDEMGNNTIVYKDKEGQLICKKAQLGAAYLATYYVYDNLHNLRYVIPQIPTGTGYPTYPTSFIETDAVFVNFIYGYHYDQRNRMTEKKIPGKGWEFMVYNTLNQVIYSQDANLRNRTPQLWKYMQYDAQGRIATTGLWSSVGQTGNAADASVASPSRVLEQYLVGLANAQTILWQTRDNTTTTGYSALAPLDPSGTILTINYYDDYTFPNNPYGSWNPSLIVPIGLLTATKTAVVNADGTYGPMLWTVHYYDDKGRETQSTKQHYKGGLTAYSNNNYDVLESTYDFIRLTNTDRFHYTSASTATFNVRIGTSYFYDHMDRPTQIWKSIYGGTMPQPSGILISQMNYNEIGQAGSKYLHSPDGGATFKQTIKYAYNERGWLTKINDPTTVTATQIFGEQLQYNDGTVPMFNGNISGLIWQTMVPTGLSLIQVKQSYAYTYDALNRLTLSNYTTASAIGKFNEQVGYDNLSNITTLKRTNSVTAGVYLNSFTYNYTSGGTGNQLWCVTDAGTAAQGSTYLYDLNGNMTKDSRNLITTITNNILNLPGTVTRTSGNISYIYDAMGEKRQKISGGITRDYIDGIEYNNGAVEFVATEEGRAVPNGTAYSYEYYLKDHLGNTRAAIKQDGTITQVQDYYAFGSDMSPGNTYASSPANNYKYNGKERQTETLDYDYGARFYDPVIARWTAVDPLAEKSRRFNPYIYTNNNPVRFIDPDGMFTIDGADAHVNGGNATYTKNKDGSVTWTNATDDTKRVGNAMLKTDVGKKELDALVSTDTKVKIEINKTDLIPTKEGGTVGAVTQATAKDKTGKITGETITIYEKGAEDYTNSKSISYIGGRSAQNMVALYNYSLEENIGAIATHEAVHATDPGSSSYYHPGQTSKTEALPYQMQLEYYNEINKQRNQ